MNTTLSSRIFVVKSKKETYLASVFDVVFNGGRKEQWVLIHDPDVFPQLKHIHVADVSSVDVNRPAADVIQTLKSYFQFRLYRPIPT